MTAFDIEGTLVRLPSARELGGGMMCLELRLSPWRRCDVDRIGMGLVIVQLDVDLDYADAWIRDHDPGDRVRVECTSLDESSEAGAEAHAVGTQLKLP